MKKVETVGTISEFMNGKTKVHHTHELNSTAKTIIKVGTFATIAILAGPHISLAAGPAMGAPGIDAGATKIYHMLTSVGKWIIIIKGGWETINSAIKQDFDSAKRNFLSYALIYVILLAFPWVMDQVDGLFSSMDVTTSGSVAP